jgi:hypothetical protein
MNTFPGIHSQRGKSFVNLFSLLCAVWEKTEWERLTDVWGDIYTQRRGEILVGKPEGKKPLEDLSTRG